MKVTCDTTVETKRVVAQMPLGTIAIVEGYGHVLRADDCLVNLNDPTNTWRLDSLIKGVALPKGAKITLEIE